MHIFMIPLPQFTSTRIIFWSFNQEVAHLSVPVLPSSPVEIVEEARRSNLDIVQKSP